MASRESEPRGAPETCVAPLRPIFPTQTNGLQPSDKLVTLKPIGLYPQTNRSQPSSQLVSTSDQSVAQPSSQLVSTSDQSVAQPSNQSLPSMIARASVHDPASENCSRVMQAGNGQRRLHLRLRLYLGSNPRARAACSTLLNPPSCCRRRRR